MMATSVLTTGALKRTFWEFHRMHCFSRTIFTASIFFSSLAVATVADAGEFRAAAAKADITPTDLVELWGYLDRSGPATGTRDPLYAKVLLLDDGSTRLAWVTLDLGRVFGRESMDQVRDRVQKSARVTHVCFSASHTHSAPAIYESYENGTRPAWETAALDKIAAAIESAANNLEPARLGAGEGSVFIGHNRRFVQPDGTVKMLWRNATKMPTHPVDPRVGVIRVDNASGKTLAVIVNYACHPVVFGPDNLQYSADYPGAVAEVVEKAFGADSLCFFLQGASGDINPYYDKMKLDEGADALMRETGRQLGAEALRVAKSISPGVPKTSEIQVSLENRRFKHRYDKDRLLEYLRALQLPPSAIERFQAYLSAPMDCVVTAVLLNREIALMGMPGEPFVEFGLNFRDRAPAPHAFFAGYCNGHQAYFPTIRAAVEGGYGAAGLNSFIEVGAGEAMVDMAVIRLLTMQGLLKTEP